MPTASNLIAFNVSGEGELIGVGNGDPNCQRATKEPKRSLFNGLAQVIVQSTMRAGEIHIEAVKEGWDGPELTPAKLTITTKESRKKARRPHRPRIARSPALRSSAGLPAGCPSQGGIAEDMSQGPIQSGRKSSFVNLGFSPMAPRRFALVVVQSGVGFALIRLG